MAIGNRALVAQLLLTGALWCMGFTSALGQGASGPRFNELSPKDTAQLDRQRALIAAVVKQPYGSSLFRSTKDLPVLQRLIDDEAFNRSQTYELQNLGVAFGDVLSSALPLHWVMITDEYGTDPTLRYKRTSVNVNALTMISTRVERGERVNLSELLRITRAQLANLEEKAQ
jgi:uncharacterized protein DUF3806